MKVSVYVPCFNGGPWLAECLDALLGQTRSPDEVLVIDDGSTDNSAAIARGYGERVRLVQHGQNRGLAVARNTALAATSGEVVASVDADVRATPAWLARLLEALDSPRTAAAGGKLLEARQERLADRWRAAHMAQHAGDFPLLNPPVVPGANVAVRRHVVRSLGGYDESFRTNYEDADLQHRLLAAGYRCRYEPAAVAYHLRTDTAASVLRTYWSWLRPPFERRGAFAADAGLTAKQAANAGLATQALWADFSGGAPSLAYLSLLVLLAFPAADRAHAARLAAAGGEAALAAQLAAAAQSWCAAVPTGLATRSSYLAQHAGGDLARVAWWDVGPFDGSGKVADLTPFGLAGAAPLEFSSGTCGSRQPPPSLKGRGNASHNLARTEGQSSPKPGDDMAGRSDADGVAALCRGIQALPRAWWPAMEEARDQLAADEGWPQ